MSIQPRFSAAIMAGEKTVELRRRPPISRPPTVVIYSSGRSRAVVGRAALAAIHIDTPAAIWARFGTSAGVSRREFDGYFAGCASASALELTAVEPAGAKLSLDGLRAVGLEPPQSWRYLSTKQLDALLTALYGLPEIDERQAAAQAVDRASARRPWPWNLLQSGTQLIGHSAAACLNLRRSLAGLDPPYQPIARSQRCGHSALNRSLPPPWRRDVTAL